MEIKADNITKRASSKKMRGGKELTDRPLVSIITPAYNEAAIIEKNLDRLCKYMTSLEHSYRWELIVVNDGSTDETGLLASQFAEGNSQVKVFHHRANRNLGGALQTGFQAASGFYVIVMDIDLTYSEEHIGQMLEKAKATDADIVLASPYMKGGKNTAVPGLRLLLSRVVNRLLRIMSPTKIHTFTGMVRLYKRDFLKTLNLKSITYTINPEIIYKTLILRGRIEEIPAHLDWSGQKNVGRSSSIRIFNGITAGLMSGFIFRPYMFFLTIGGLMFLIAFYIIIWIFIHTFNALPQIPVEAADFETRFGMAVAIVFQDRPYSFLVGGVALIISFQFLGIGFLSLQNKRYFEEIFHINTTMLRNQLDSTNETGKPLQ